MKALRTRQQPVTGVRDGILKHLTVTCIQIQSPTQTRPSQMLKITAATQTKNGMEVLGATQPHKTNAGEGVMFRSVVSVSESASSV